MPDHVIVKYRLGLDNASFVTRVNRWRMQLAISHVLKQPCRCTVYLQALILSTGNDTVVINGRGHLGITALTLILLAPTLLPSASDPRRVVKVSTLFPLGLEVRWRDIASTIKSCTELWELPASRPFCGCFTSVGTIRPEMGEVDKTPVCDTKDIFCRPALPGWCSELMSD